MLSRAEVDHFYAGNIWPDEPALFRRRIEDLYEALSTLSTAVAGFFDRAFLAGSGAVTAAIRDHVSEMVVNFYPPASGSLADAQMRRGAHRDFDLFTLLVPDYETGGLEIADSEGRWIRVEAEPASLVVIVGGLMPILTNRRVPAPRHRVVVPHDDMGRQKERVSFAYFVEPDPGYTLDVSILDGELRRRRAGLLIMDQIAGLVPPELRAS
ncbi:MAG TPA: 2OG-Fe(II) oxygenase family protein [Candidatus Dormibacteraeota bacterium]